MFNFLCDDPGCGCRKAVEEMLMRMVVNAQCSPSRASLILTENVKITFDIPQHLGGGIVEFTSHESAIPVEDTDIFKIRENQQQRRGNPNEQKQSF